MPAARSTSTTDLIALGLAALALGLSLWVGEHVFERMAHIEDELAYLWQAQVLARGALTRPTPDFPDHFLVPFVVDHAGQRFGKYPLGWPLVLSLGLRLGLRAWLNPLLGALSVWLTYRLGARLLDARTGLLAAALLAVSPFFLLNTGSLLSHPLGLALSTSFALFWVDSFTAGGRARWWKSAALGLTLGVLALTRPLSAVAVALPFFVHGLWLLWRGDRQTRANVLAIGLLAAAVGALQLVWQYAVTGDALTNPYTLWWPYDRFGFGPDAGRHGHELALALNITGTSLRALADDLHGWPRLSWLFLPIGLWALRRQRTALFVVSPLVVLITLYSAYWIGAWLYGPRYYFEGLYAAVLLSAAGILHLWDHALGAFALRWQRWGLSALLVVLFGVSLFSYLPQRFAGMRGLYGVNRAMLAPFAAGRMDALTPAIIIVHPQHWAQYGGLLELQDAWLEEDVIFVITRNVIEDAAFTDFYTQKGWAVYHYYPDEPQRLYTGVRP